MTPGAHVRRGQGHVLFALEAVLATATAELIPSGDTPVCGPAALRPASCPVFASATVADPRTTQQVLDLVRWTLFPGAERQPAHSVLATITVDESRPGAVTVNFLRN